MEDKVRMFLFALKREKDELMVMADADSIFEFEVEVAKQLHESKLSLPYFKASKSRETIDMEYRGVIFMPLGISELKGVFIYKKLI